VGTGEADDVVSGRSHDRQWAAFMSASGQLRGRLRAVSRGRRHQVPILVMGTSPRRLRVHDSHGCSSIQCSDACSAAGSCGPQRYVDSFLQREHSPAGTLPC
jgi:hypothetical protein